mmetsp:Transcript_37854/g.90571  ORF Transcript_37854/g.90571 Transcript_37854/m.90571 type:complete len:645 (-) Transcript_37854:3612-5546(-)
MRSDTQAPRALPTVLQYPFHGFSSTDLDNACAGLGLLAFSRDDYVSEQRNIPIEPAPGILSTLRRSRTPPVYPLTQRELDTLRPGVLINDGPLNLAMLWLLRFESAPSQMHLFNTHLYLSLYRSVHDLEPQSRRDQSAMLASFTRSIDIFSKRWIFIPIFQHTHYSLIAIANPGYIRNCFHDDDGSTLVQDRIRVNEIIPCIIHLDSLQRDQLHPPAEIYSLIMKWLNDEFSRRQDLPAHPFPQRPFIRQTTKFITPQVPQQPNSCDCGMYTLRYFYGFIRKRFVPIRACDVFGRAAQFITNSSEFSFSHASVSTLRHHCHQLQRNLSSVYKERRTQFDTALSQDSDDVLAIYSPAKGSTDKIMASVPARSLISPQHSSVIGSAAHRPTTLPNLGSTCYMSSCLLLLKGITSHILDSRQFEVHPIDTDKADILRSMQIPFMAFVGALHTNNTDRLLLKSILSALYKASKFPSGNQDVNHFYTDRLLPLLRAKKVDCLFDIRLAISRTWSGTKGDITYNCPLVIDEPCLTVNICSTMQEAIDDWAAARPHTYRPPVLEEELETAKAIHAVAVGRELNPSEIQAHVRDYPPIDGFTKTSLHRTTANPCPILVIKINRINHNSVGMVPDYSGLSTRMTLDTVRDLSH